MTGVDSVPDTSAEIDFDYFHLDDIKLRPNQTIYVVLDRQMHIVTPAYVCTTMDELAYIKFTSMRNLDCCWEATDRGRILIEGVWETSQMGKELSRIESILRQQEQ